MFCHFRRKRIWVLFFCKKRVTIGEKGVVPYDNQDKICTRFICSAKPKRHESSGGCRICRFVCSPLSGIGNRQSQPTFAHRHTLGFGVGYQFRCFERQCVTADSVSPVFRTQKRTPTSNLSGCVESVTPCFVCVCCAAAQRILQFPQAE